MLEKIQNEEKKVGRAKVKASFITVCYLCVGFAAAATSFTYPPSEVAITAVYFSIVAPSAFVACISTKYILVGLRRQEKKFTELHQRKFTYGRNVVNMITKFRIMKSH